MKYQIIVLLLSLTFNALSIQSSPFPNEPLGIPHDSLERHIQETGSIRMLLALLLAGADPNSSSTTSNPPIFAAIEKGRLDALKILVTWGAKVDTRNIHGLSPLEAARKAIQTADKNKSIYTEIEKYIWSVHKQPSNLA